MKIDAITQSLPGKEISQKFLDDTDEVSDGKFSNILSKTIGETNEMIKSADQASQEVAVGRSENLHEAMISMEKAETAFRFLVQVRNKAMDAYHEIMRMQL